MSTTVSLPGHSDIVFGSACGFGASAECETSEDCSGGLLCYSGICQSAGDPTGGSSGTSSCNCSSPNIFDVECTTYCAFMSGKNSSDTSWVKDALNFAKPYLPALCAAVHLNCPAFWPGTNIPFVVTPWYETPTGLLLAVLGVGALGFGVYYAMS